MRTNQLIGPKIPYHFHDPEIERMAATAFDLGAFMAGGFSQYSEQALLNGMFGNCCGMVRVTIAAAATAQTAVTTGSLANGGASGNMDQTPASTAFIATGTPGTTPNFNTYTAPHAFLLTASAATTLTIASQSVGLAVTAGDCIFTGGAAAAGGSTTALAPMWMLNRVWIGLSTGSTQATMNSGEPTAATGGYQRIGTATSTPATLWNNQANFPIASAASPSVLTTANGPWSFPASSAAWSSGATNLASMFFSDSPTAGAGNVLAWGPLGVAQAVNASGITLSFATGAITLTLT